MRVVNLATAGYSQVASFCETSKDTVQRTVVAERLV
jgi:hypothetical protein